MITYTSCATTTAASANLPLHGSFQQQDQLCLDIRTQKLFAALIKH